MIRRISPTLQWMRALPLLLSAIAFHGLACGPDFPNWLLTDSEAVLRKPEAYFGKELERMRLVTTTNVAQTTDDPVRNTLEMDVADLRQALREKETPNARIQAVLARYQAERMKARPSVANEPEPGTNPAPVARAEPQVPAGLPAEFEDYFRGAIAWHQTNLPAARREWLRLLKRPPAERRYKSTWAAFMLGKSWETNDAGEAIHWYRRVRELARSGFVDSLGLSVESLGWEARLQWQDKQYVAAVELYLEQAAAGDPTAEISLRLVAADALRRGRTALNPLARNLRSQRLITAYVISGGFRRPAIDIDGQAKETALLLWSKASGRWSQIPAPNTAWHQLREPAKIWLEAVETARVRDVEAAEQLALAAYQAGEMDLARRWLDRARPTPAANWVRAKLHLRDGKLTEGLALLAQVEQAVQAGRRGTNSAADRELVDSLFMNTRAEGDQEAASPTEAVRAEMALIHLRRGRYVESLDLLLHSSPEYWMDAAYVAERVLRLDELKSYVEQRFPVPPSQPPEPERQAHREEAERYEPPPLYRGAEGIRYLLARRLARAYRFAEARPYYPPEWQPAFTQLSTAWQQAEDTSKSLKERGLALLEASVLTRKYGLELIGTEVEPDWRIHQGNFEDGVSVQWRVSLVSTNLLAASQEEIQRAFSHGVRPELRWHYRTVASVIGWEAAKLLRAAEIPIPAERARTLFEAGRLLAENGISYVSFMPQKHSAPQRGDSAEATTIASRVARELASGPAINNLDPMRPLSAPQTKPEALWDSGLTSAALAWDAAQVLPNNSDETARILCQGGLWVNWDPHAADVLYKALVRRCRKTALGAEADRIRWFPRIDAEGKILPRKERPAQAGADQARTEP